MALELNNPEAEYYEATREDQHKHILSLWEIMQRFADLAEQQGASENEIFRWQQARFKVAFVARCCGVMHRDAFDLENKRYISMIAGVLGSSAVTIRPH